jgi:hypothetical protein
MEILVLKFAVPKNITLSIDKKDVISLSLPEGQVKFKITMNDTVLYRTFSLVSDDLEINITQETIKKMWESLYLLCIDLDISILIDPGLIPFFIPQRTLDEMSRISKLDVQSDFFGVKLISSQPAFISTGLVTIQNESDINFFEDLFNKYSNLKLNNTDRIIRAIQIYNSSNYLSIVNYTAKFILLISAIESLIEQTAVSAELALFIEKTQNEVAKIKIEDNEKESFRSQLGNLKRTSIRRSALKMIGQLLEGSKLYNGYSPAKFFDLAYDLRSKFVHDGFTKTEYLDMKHNQLQTFTKDLISSYFKKVCC